MNRITVLVIFLFWSGISLAKHPVECVVSKSFPNMIYIVEHSGWYQKEPHIWFYSISKVTGLGSKDFFRQRPSSSDVRQLATCLEPKLGVRIDRLGVDENDVDNCPAAATSSKTKLASKERWSSSESGLLLKVVDRPRNQIDFLINYSGSQLGDRVTFGTFNRKANVRFDTWICDLW